MQKIFSCFLIVFLLLSLNLDGQAAQISRLKDPEISNGNSINASDLGVEFNQLVNESNSQDTRLNTIEGSNQTLSGVKMFASIPVLPASDPTTANQAVRKSYVDNYLPTGSVIMFFSSSAPTGWVLLDGKTIGNAASSATERANADTANLYTFLWGTCADTQCPVSTGRGASASADFAANKTLQLPDIRGRLPLGLDNLGGSAANRVTSASLNGSNSTTLGAAGGEQAHTQTLSELVGHTHVVNNIANLSGSSSTSGSGSIGTGSVTSASTGGGAAFNVMNPWLGLAFIIKL
jgi:hypothetical protein